MADTNASGFALTRRAATALLLIVGASAIPASAAPRFFSPEAYTPTEMGGSGPATAADLNGDGRPDLIQANLSGDVAVRLNLGASDFGPKALYPVGASQISLVVGDVTRDDIPDIVTSREYFDGVQLSGELSVLPGRGDGTFGPRQALPVGRRPFAIAIADVDGDGRGDLIAANAQSNTLTLYRSIPGGFAPRADIPTGSYPADVAVARLDADAYRIWSYPATSATPSAFTAGSGVARLLRAPRFPRSTTRARSLWRMWTATPMPTSSSETSSRTNAVMA